MAYKYNSNIEESDEGYSIPKILVAVLLLILIGTGIYIYFQQKKLETSISYLLNSKKQAEEDLNKMIEKYNLAIDDNDGLQGNLLSERDALIKYRDSLKKIKKEDLKKNNNITQTISNLKKKSSIKSISSEEISSPTETQISKTVVSKEEISSPTETQISKTVVSKEEISTLDSLPANNTETNTTSSSIAKEEEKQPIIKTQTDFKRVEVPPIYPGCKGSIIEKKLCFEKSILKHLSKKFNTSVINNLSMTSGKKKIWINFDINKNGDIVNVTARAPRNISSRAKKMLESEAILTVNKLKKMTPAKQNGEPVNMNYTVPLTIMVQ